MRTRESSQLPFSSPSDPQVYHTLPSTAALLDVRKCLNDEDGALGLLWARRAPPRATGHPSAPTVGHTTLDVPSTPAGVSTRPLSQGESPIDWADGLGVAQFGFRPLKHRRFRFDVNPGAAADWLHAVADDRSASPPGPLAGDVGIDVHSFHAACSPPPHPV